jgi:hypothetical protein
MTGKSGMRSVLSGDIDPGSLTAQVDTAGLDDGVYELKVGATTADGKQSRPWYSLVTVANHPQQITVRLSPSEFDPSQPASGRIYFMIDVAAQDVPLTQADVVITKADGTPVKTVPLQNPGSQAKFGWRTGMYPNGSYKVSVVGKIGTLQSFPSNSLTVTVKN